MIKLETFYGQWENSFLSVHWPQTQNVLHMPRECQIHPNRLIWILPSATNKSPDNSKYQMHYSQMHDRQIPISIAISISHNMSNDMPIKLFVMRWLLFITVVVVAHTTVRRPIKYLYSHTIFLSPPIHTKKTNWSKKKIITKTRSHKNLKKKLNAMPCPTGLFRTKQQQS